MSHRASRARSSQQPPAAPSHTPSSTSVNSNQKNERNTRSNNRNSSAEARSNTPSGSIADDHDAAQVAPRRSRRGEEKDKDKSTKDTRTNKEEEEDNGIVGAEEDVTRCICGLMEYPGPSQAVRDQYAGQDTIPEDAGNFFVQCDNCHVWQHGGCMGLSEETMVPDEYYCEQCKPDYHKIMRGSNGPRSSRYLPVLEAASFRSSSLSSLGDPSKKKETRPRTLESTKRRATMNSRVAYDDDELLRRAIEESKEMGTLGKRSRDEDDHNKQNPKRPRTASSSPSVVSKHSGSPEPASGQKPTDMAAQKLRGNPARTTKEKEVREQQKQEAAAVRAEAANKRKARSERRRAEDSPPPTPSLSPAKAASTTNTKSKPDTPLLKQVTNKKTGRPPARRGRLGRNQYTRDKDLNGDDYNTPVRDSSHDRNGNGHSPAHNGINGESGRSSKAKTHPARTSLNEMKRRVAAILEFVGRMQTERNPQSQQSSSRDSSKGTSTPNGVGSHSNLPTASLVKAVEVGLEKANGIKDGRVPMKDDKDFQGMNSVDMMDSLTQELVGWQSIFGVYSR